MKANRQRYHKTLVEETSCARWRNAYIPRRIVLARSDRLMRPETELGQPPSSDRLLCYGRGVIQERESLRNNPVSKIFETYLYVFFYAYFYHVLLLQQDKLRRTKEIVNHALDQI